MMSLRQILQGSYTMTQKDQPGLGVALTAPMIQVDDIETKMLLSSLSWPAPMFDLNSTMFDPPTSWIESKIEDVTSELSAGCAIEKVSEKSWVVSFFYAYVRDGAIQLWQSPLLLDLRHRPSSGVKANVRWLEKMPSPLLEERFMDRDRDLLILSLMIMSRHAAPARRTLH